MHKGGGLDSLTEVNRTSGGVDDWLEELVSRAVRLVLEGSPPRRLRHRPDVRRLYDVPSAASQISVSEAKTWELIRDGRLRAVKVDGRTLVQAQELDRFATEEIGPY